MIETISLFVAPITAVMGMGWLALRYQMHWQQVFPETGLQPEHIRLKLAGWCSLLLSAVSCLGADHPSMAALVWVMLLALAGLLVAMLLAFRPKILRWICLPVFVKR